jgi:hypothetical protein
MQVIPTCVAISGHLQQCAATAELESGENVENSLLAGPDGESHVQPTVVVFKQDPWVDFVTKQGSRKGDQETKEREEERKEEGRTKKKEWDGNARTDERMTMALMLLLPWLPCCR